MRSLQWLVVVLLTLSTSLSAEIRELSTFAELPHYVDEETWVFLDVDDTLLVPQTCIGSMPWWRDTMKQLEACGVERDHIHNLFHRLCPILWLTIPIAPTEPCVPEIIRQLQNKAASVLGHTARQKTFGRFNHFDEITRDNLEAIDIHFDCSTHTCEGDSYAFLKGIISHKGGNMKGPVLQEFLDDHNTQPKRVVFVDDRLDQLQSVEATLQARGIDVLGLHYRRCEQRHAHFEAAIGAIQLRAFLTGAAIPSDFQAQMIWDRDGYPSVEEYLKPWVDWYHENSDEAH